MTAKKKTTARATGPAGNQFASVEQGRSYVLSVHAPSGAGEIELLAADSDQQSEPDMFSMLYEKIETARQIPFVAISPFVFVNVGSSDVQWLITPANFSIAVPGASSGGGSSFDPTADQSITGAWTFSNISVPIPTLQGMAANKQYVDTSVVTRIGLLAIRFSSLTKAEYDALETKSNSTIYYLTDKSKWAIGDKEIVTSDMPA